MKKRIKQLLKVLGPGFITGAAANDPSSIATYSQTGAQFGTLQAWTTFFSFPLLTAIQEMCGRVGITTGQGLTATIRKHYSKSLLFIVVLLVSIANIINIGADLSSMAASAQLIIHIPFAIWLFLFVIVTLILQIFSSYENYAKYLKFLSLILFSYLITAFLAHVNWQQVAVDTLFPHIKISKVYFLNIVAVMGTNISPYLFFWQSSQEVEAKIVPAKNINPQSHQFIRRNILYLRIDTLIGMFFSTIIMWFITITTGSTLYPNHIYTIQSAAEAAMALKPFAGRFAEIIFAVGIIGAGLLAVPVLITATSYVIAETFSWSNGLHKSFREAPAFYSVVILCTILGLAVNLIRVDPIRMLYFSAIINGIVAIPLVVIIMIITNNKRIMKRYTNNVWLNMLGIVSAIVLCLSALFLLIEVLPFHVLKTK